MILEQETKDKFKYSVDSLIPGSGRNIIYKCDYCGNIFEKQYRHILMGRILVNKDSCGKCRHLKTKECNLIQYGIEDTSKLESIKNKIIQTNLQKYGVPCASQATEVKEKMKKTCLERYGVEYATQAEISKQNRLKTFNEKYGVNSAMEIPEIVEKFKKLWTPELKEKKRKTCQEKYGVDVPSQSQEIKDKILNTRIKNGFVHTRDGKNGTEWAKEFSVSACTFNLWVRDYGWETAVQKQKYQSGLESHFSTWLKSKNIDFKSQILIETKRPDFIINNLIIELDGLYWHSEIFRPNDFHSKRRKFFIKHGYIPLFFRENEVKKKFSIVQSIVLNKLGKSNRIYARKTELKEVSKKDSKEFFQNSHLMGPGKGKSFGLYFDNELVALIQVINKKDALHISRFCTKLNISVVGGYSKLLKYIEKTFKPSKIINFVDLRYGTGEHLLKLGFKLEREGLSFQWTNFYKTFGRMKYRGNSGYKEKLVKIYDCGQAKFIKWL